jgi:hypothetical protein
MVAIMNPTYLAVLQGTVTATNAGGTATLRAGDLGAAAADATLAAIVPASALPAAVTTAFGSLGALRMAPRASPGAAGKAAPAEDARGRDLKDRPGRDYGRDASGVARERARELKPRPK